MILKYWSVPILNESRLELPGPTPAQRRVQTTTTYDLSDRRLHVLKLNLFEPGALLAVIGLSVLFFVLIYVFTLFVPGIVLAVTKDESLGWLFGAWAVPVLVAAVLIARKSLIDKKMMRFAVTERGTPLRKIHLVAEDKWDRWVARLR